VTAHRDSRGPGLGRGVTVLTVTSRTVTLRVGNTYKLMARRRELQAPLESLSRADSEPVSLVTARSGQAASAPLLLSTMLTGYFGPLPHPGPWYCRI
jgi:hypothetical protein